jgi:hypothetical protein
MATRSGIGIERGDGTVVGVYCHWDGYPEGVGRMLEEHYRDPVKITALVELGSISSLAPEIGEQHPFDERREDWTTFYGRDRRETGTEPKTVVDRETFRDELRRSGVEFLYVFTAAGDWLVAKPFGRWRSLPAVLEHGVELLVEPDPDRGPDIMVERESPLASVVLLRGVTGPGRDWLDRHVEEDAPVFGDRIAAETRFAVAIVDGARRDGLVVEEDRS